jgi:hypothetical protein
MSEDLTNHEVTVCLKGGAVLGPFREIWSKDRPTDIRELSIEYEDFFKANLRRASSIICTILAIRSSIL